MEDKKRYLFDNAKNVNIVLYSLYICCGLLVLLDFVVHRHIIHNWERLLGFYSIYGFVACTAIVFGSKALRVLVSRSEDYYERDDLESGRGGHHVDE